MSFFNKILELLGFGMQSTIAPNVKSASKILNIIQKEAENDTLIVFDVDNVLSIPSDLAIRQGWRIYQKLEKQSNINQLIDQICLQAKRELVDMKMQGVLEYIHENNLRSFALTHCNYDAILGFNPTKYSTWAEWRYDFLIQIGIDFKLLSQLKDELNDKQLIYGKLYKGIVLTGGEEKGMCLQAALEAINIHPSKIIFVDDHMHNIKSVQQMCGQENINFYGIHYTRAEELERQNTPNDSRESLQAQNLIHSGIWLSDAEADAQLQILTHHSF